jgi:hypothetical protein
MAEFPAVGFETVTFVGAPNVYSTYDTYGFDQYELTMGIRIKNLTGISPTRDDADYCLSAIRDNNLTLIAQNTLISNYMTNKYT